MSAILHAPKVGLSSQIYAKKIIILEFFNFVSSSTKLLCEPLITFVLCSQACT